MNKYCTYIRVSTKRQGASGLGLDAQRKMCMDYITSQNGELIREFQDVESGTHRDRPGLASAVDFCIENKCTLVIAKLDRLARDVEFVFKISNSGVQIYIVDMPILNTLTLGVFASVAQYERELCSNRTKAALNEIKDDIARNGGHMSKAGRWVKSLGREKGTKIPDATAASAVASQKRADEWKKSSPLYKWVARQLKAGRRQKDILAEALTLYEDSPTVFCTREGKPLCWGTLSKWCKELQFGI